MRFSIVTCTKNSMSTLAETVNSVRSQQIVEAEHIFVDGQSSDGTMEWLRSLGYGRVVIEEQPSGIAAAMNVGIANATGDIICHLHSDDYFLHPRVLANVSHFFENLGCDWLFGRILIDEDGSLYPETYKAPMFSFHSLIRSNFVPHQAAFVRRSVFERMGGFREDLRYAMDYEYWLRISRVCRVAQVNELFSVFRRHGGSATHSNRLASLEEEYLVRKEYCDSTILSRAEHKFRYMRRKRWILRGGLRSA